MKRDTILQAIGICASLVVTAIGASWPDLLLWMRAAITIFGVVCMIGCGLYLKRAVQVPKTPSTPTAAIWVAPGGSIDNSTISNLRVRGIDHAIIAEGPITGSVIEDVDHQGDPKKIDD